MPVFAGAALAIVPAAFWASVVWFMRGRVAARDGRDRCPRCFDLHDAACPSRGWDQDPDLRPSGPRVEAGGL